MLEKYGEINGSEKGRKHCVVENHWFESDFGLIAVQIVATDRSPWLQNEPMNS